MASVLAAFGFPYGKTIEYIEWVQLVLNLDMVSYRGAIAVARGTSVVHSMSDLNESWADAMAIDASEVDEILFRLNSARQLARAKARLGF